MPRFTTPVSSRIRELRERLTIIQEGSPPILEIFLSEFGSLVGARTGGYGVQVEDQGYSMSFGLLCGFTVPREAAREIINSVVRSPKRQLGLFTPARIEPRQRNVAVAFPRNSQVIQASAILPRHLAVQMESFEVPAKRAYAVAFARLGIEHEHQLRVLVCNGPSLLAWIGAFRPEPYVVQERRILQALTPALQRRLTLESHWEAAVFNARAIPVLLENIPSAALIVAASGRIQQANAVARQVLSENSKELRESIYQALRGRSVPSVVLTRIAASGWPTYYLAVVTNPADPSKRAGLARSRWGLTQREAELLVHLASGGSNKTIAACLDCTVRTVEQHITHILEKMQVENRATAIAHFWSELD